MNRKQIGFLCCAVILMMLLAGCGNNRQGDNDAPGTPAVHGPVQTEGVVPPVEKSVPTTESESETSAPAGEKEPSQTESQPPATAPGQSDEDQHQGGASDSHESTETVLPAPMPAPTETAPELTAPAPVVEDTLEEGETAKMKMNVQIGDSTFTATLEGNDAARSLVELLGNGPLVIQMSDYAGFEKVGPLGTSLPASNSQTTTQAGDIVLYQGNQIVLFYGTNSWSYTRLWRFRASPGAGPRP